VHWGWLVFEIFLAVCQSGSERNCLFRVKSCHPALQEQRLQIHPIKLHSEIQCFGGGLLLLLFFLLLFAFHLCCRRYIFDCVLFLICNCFCCYAMIFFFCLFVCCREFFLNVFVFFIFDFLLNGSFVFCSSIISWRSILGACSLVTCSPVCCVELFIPQRARLALLVFDLQLCAHIYVWFSTAHALDGFIVVSTISLTSTACLHVLEHVCT
jgi:hypothetical protein